MSGASVDASVAPIVDAAGAHVPALMLDVERRLHEAARGHGAPLDELAGDTIAAGGKRLRPLLVLLAAGRPGDEPAALVRAAAAVELVHAATLVHDDVLDRAELRRGRPTVVARGGRELATATGDLLFSRAFALLARNRDVEQIRALSAASSALARGELLQRADAWDAGVTRARYLERCELKTGRLFEAACRLGALAAGRRSLAGALGRFGTHVGVAFQLLDDVLDVSGPAERTGKHRGTDLLDGTITLPFVLARQRDPALAAIDPRSIADPERAEAVCDAIAATGALDQARADAGRMVEQARAALPAELDGSQRRALELVAEGVVARYA